jgi:hypothetical protein
MPLHANMTKRDSSTDAQTGDSETLDGCMYAEEEV